MKASDAKAPKFDSKWWKLNKAKVADSDGQFCKALEAYEAFRKKFAGSQTADTSDLTALKKAVTELKFQATRAANDKALGVLQKDTKESLNSYAKTCEAVLKYMDRVQADPMMKMTSEQLVKQVPQFKTFCQKEHTMENWEFIAAMQNSGTKKDRALYELHIKKGASKEVNIGDPIVKKFDDAAKAIAADPVRFPDTPATWSLAPWPKALDEVARMTNQGTVANFRKWVSAQLLTPKLP